MMTFRKYSALDSIITYEIAEELEKELKDFGMWEFYREVSHPLIAPLFEMSLQGVKLDLDKMAEVRKLLKEEIATLQEQLDTLVGHPLNVYSNKQMKEFLYDELKLKTKYKNRKATRARTITADEQTIRELNRINNIPALDLILELIERRKLLSTYLEVKLDEDKRIRTSYLITGTETGRLASRATPKDTGTNLQNIPRGSFRNMFIPDEGKVFVSADLSQADDLSQAEARVVAYLAGDTRLISVFTMGGDIHKRNASNIFHKKEEEVTKEERTLAKRIVHASHYGMGPMNFARVVSIPLTEAKRLLNQYFATYPGLKLWHMKTQQELKRTRTVSYTHLTLPTSDLV